MPVQGFQEPNYTQTPNEFYDKLLAEIDSLSELKVTLAIIRETFGWHRSEKELSISTLERLTGLSRPSVVEGIGAALKRGFIYRTPKGQRFAYGLNVQLVKNLNQLEDVTSKESLLVTSKDSLLVTSKESLPAYKDKESSKEKKKDALSARTREACSVFESVYGESPHLHGQSEIEAADIADPNLWRDVCRQCKGNRTPAKNVGTMLAMYRERVERNGREPTAKRSGYGRAPITRDYSKFRKSTE